MRIAELLAHGRTFSFEFFPPKTDEAQAQLATTIAELAPLKPSFFSVTYGALGSTRSRTRDVVVELARSGTVPPMAHLTCVGHTRSDIDLLLGEYKAAGVENILALGGDLPEDPSTLGPSEFDYALELVEHLRANFDVSIGVAAHPEVHPRSTSRDSDRKHLAEKLRLADFAMTQFFFENDQYFRYLDRVRARGIGIPIVPGVLPVQNFKQTKSFAERCGASVPRWLAERFDGLDDDVATRKLIAAAVAAEQVLDLVDRGVTDFHFYTMNRADLVYAICHLLGLRPATKKAV